MVKKMLIVQKMFRARISGRAVFYAEFKKTLIYQFFLLFSQIVVPPDVWVARGEGACIYIHAYIYIYIYIYMYIYIYIYYHKSA